MTPSLKTMMAFVALFFLILPMAACSSEDSPQDAPMNASTNQRLMTAPVQQDIIKAQQAASLSELYAEGQPPRIGNAPREDIQEISAIAQDIDAPDAGRSIADVAQDITQEAPPAELPDAPTQSPAPVAAIADEPSQSNPLTTREEQARINAAVAQNIPLEEALPFEKASAPPESPAAMPVSEDSVVIPAPIMDAPPRVISNAPDNSPKLNAGETLRVSVFNDPDMSGEYEIDNRGVITMPLLGDVQAAGLTQNALQNAIENKLAVNGILVDPNVSIEIIGLRPFYILGEVRTPGSYPTVPNMDVFKALAIAGGLTPRAVDDEFIIYRGVGENRQKIDAREDTLVYPGDSIKVKERFF